MISYHFLQTAKDYHNQFIDPMTLMKELGLYVHQDVYHTSQQKHQYIRDVTKNKVCRVRVLQQDMAVSRAIGNEQLFQVEAFLYCSCS